MLNYVILDSTFKFDWKGYIYMNIVPIHQRKQRMKLALEATIRKEVDKMLDANVIFLVKYLNG